MDKRIKSVEDRIASISDHREQIDLLNKLSWEISRIDPEKGLELAVRSHALAVDNYYASGRGEALRNQAACHTWLANYEEALGCAKLALELFTEKEDDPNVSQTLYIIGAIFYFLADFESSLKYMLQCLKLTEHIKFSEGKIEALNGIGLAYNGMNSSDKALDYLFKSVALARESGNKYMEAKVLDSLGGSFIKLGNYSKAKDTFYECLELISSLGDQRGLSFALNGIGYCLYKEGDFEGAEDKYKEALKLREKLKFKQGLVISHLNYGELHFARKDYKLALKSFKMGLKLGEEIKVKAKIYKLHKGLSEVYEAIKDTDNFVVHLKRYYEIKEVVFNEDSSSKTRSLELQFELERSEKAKELKKSHDSLEAVSQNVKLLSDIGKAITSSLTIDTIASTTYFHLKGLMDVQSFSIGVLDLGKDRLGFINSIRDGKKIPHYCDYLEDKSKLSVWCYDNEQEVFINDYLQEFLEFKLGIEQGVDKDPTESIIYLPIMVRSECLGLIGVHSNLKNAYTVYHLDMVRNLAVYVGIAIENARLYEDLEEKVKERTQEVMNQTREIQKQNAQLEQSFENIRLLSEIGQQVIATLSIEKIIDKVYKNVDKLMDASAFVVGVYNLKEERLEFPNVIEKGEVLPFHFVTLEQSKKFPVICFENRRTIIVNNMQKECKKITGEKPYALEGETVESLIYVPLVVKDQTIGVLSVQSFEKNAYTQYHLSILKNLAVYIAIALDNANLYLSLENTVKERTAEVVAQKEEVERSHNDTKLMSQIGKSITRQLSVERIAEMVYSKANELMDANILWIGLFNQKKKLLEFKGAFEKGKKLPTFSIPLEDEKRLSSVCFNDGEEIVINDYEIEYIKYSMVMQKPVKGGIPASVVYIPLTSHGNKLGVLTVQSYEINAYSEYQINIIRNLAVYIAIGVENALMYEDMEEKVNERTLEVVAQKEEIEVTYQNNKLLSQIGRDITATLSVDRVIEKCYENVNKLMDATVFNIGIYNSRNNAIDFPAAIEKGQRLPFHGVPLDYTSRLPVICYTKRKEILISDLVEEAKSITGEDPVAMEGEIVSSLIYIPIYIKDDVVGVMSVQSFEKNAYTDYHLDILKNLAVYVGIAMDNARVYDSLNIVKEEIEQKNLDITDSIIYAKRIQEAILTPHVYLERVMGEYFLLNMPRDIVSGDFYWAHQTPAGDLIFLVADCTGHGVPGAFMSMISIRLLEEIIMENCVYEPNQILTILRRRIIRSLGQTGAVGEAQDGLDIALCVWKKEERVIHFAGAYNPLWILRDGKVTEVKGDKQPIGHHIDSRKPFTKQTVPVLDGDMIYIFSDGYVDQFGGPNEKKYKQQQFKEKLEEIHDTSLVEQGEILKNEFKDWKGDLEQIDDVCVIGLKITSKK